MYHIVLPLRRDTDDEDSEDDGDDDSESLLDYENSSMSDGNNSDNDSNHSDTDDGTPSPRLDAGGWPGLFATPFSTSTTIAEAALRHKHFSNLMNSSDQMMVSTSDDVCD